MNTFFDEKSKVWDQQQYRIIRAQEIAKIVRERIPLSKRMNALDFGCGTGLLGFNLIDDVGYMTFSDTSDGMLTKVKEKVQDKKITNAKMLNLKENSRKSNRFIKSWWIHLLV